MGARVAQGAKLDQGAPTKFPRSSRATATFAGSLDTANGAAGLVRDQVEAKTTIQVQGQQVQARRRMGSLPANAIIAASPGHKKSDCWALNGKGKGGAKGAQAPPKPKAASSLESHPEPEPASASGLELCSVEMATITVVGEGEEV